MTDNKPVRKNLSLGTTVSPMSNYISKAPALSSGVGDGLLRLAKNLEDYNPALKTLGEEREKKLMEEGYAEAVKFAEETGALKEHQTLWNEYQAKHPEMTSLNPYLKRFLDGKTVERLVVERNNHMSLAYTQKGWAGLNNEAYQKAVAEENASWYKANQGLLDSLDSREVAAKFDKSTQGMYASLNETHLKAESERFIKQRAAEFQGEISYAIDKSKDKLTEGFNKLGIDAFNIGFQDKEKQALAEKVITDSGILNDVFTIIDTFKGQGLTQEEAELKFLEVSRQRAIKNPYIADEMILLGRVAVKDSKTISKEALAMWEIAVDKEATEEAKRLDGNVLYQEKLQEEQNIFDITKAYGTLDINEAKTLTSEQIRSRIKLRDGSPAGIEYMGHINILHNATIAGTTNAETGTEQLNFARLYTAISNNPETITMQDIMDSLSHHEIHISRFQTLSTHLEKQTEGGSSAAQKKNQDRYLAIQFTKSLLADLSPTQQIIGEAFLRQELDSQEVNIGRSLNSYENLEYAKKIMPDYKNFPVVTEEKLVPYTETQEKNTELFLGDKKFGQKLFGYVRQGDKYVLNKPSEELENNVKLFKQNPQELNKLIKEAFGFELPDDALTVAINMYEQEVSDTLKGRAPKEGGFFNWIKKNLIKPVASIGMSSKE